MSTDKHQAWALIQPITQVKANTRGAFGVAAAFTAEDGTDYVLMARDKATVRRMALRIDPNTEINDKLFYPVAMVQSSMVVLEDDEL
jgi:hypothetical protein